MKTKTEVKKELWVTDSYQRKDDWLFDLGLKETLDIFAETLEWIDGYYVIYSEEDGIFIKKRPDHKSIYWKDWDNGKQNEN